MKLDFKLTISDNALFVVYKKRKVAQRVFQTGDRMKNCYNLISDSLWSFACGEIKLLATEN